MNMNYITKIKANINIYASKKTSNILDGSYRSIYKGKSMNFEDLRNYVIGDNIKDIDWKATARSNSILIRQYVAEKKHNIMLVFDSGKKMLGDTNQKEGKKEVAIISAGTLAYLANKNGDYVGAIYEKKGGIEFYPFKSGLHNIEKILTDYESKLEEVEISSIENSLKYISENVRRRMIIFVFTDLDGMEKVKESTLKVLSTLHDVMFVNINDGYIYGDLAYDVENDKYIPEIFLNDNKLYEIEKNIKEELYSKCIEKLKKYNISTTTIESCQESVIKIIELLEEHKNANIS